MELAITGGSSKITVNDAVFDRPFSEPLVHQVVVAFLAGARAGTKAPRGAGIQATAAQPLRRGRRRPQAVSPEGHR